MAGADIEPPAEPFGLDVRVSHHGTEAVSGTVHAAWVAAGAPVDRPVPHPDATSAPLKAEPFRLSFPVTLEIPPKDGPARLLLWLADTEHRVVARTFLDAVEVEPPNRRGARPGEFEDAPIPGLR